MIDCPVDEFIPLPTKGGGKTEKLSYAEVRSRAKAACAAAALLNSEGYKDHTDIEFVQAVAQDALRGITQTGEMSSAQASAMMGTPEACLYVDSLLTAYDHEVVRDAKRLRHYVTNRLIVETENPDARIRMRALELLGKISDVGLFTERTEITVNNRSTVDLENSLREKLRKLRGVDTAEDVTYVPVEAPRPDVAKALAGL